MGELPKRKPNRLKEYDYSQDGAYFITICVKDRQELLGEIVGDGLARPAYANLSEYGKIVEQELNRIQFHYHDVILDQYVVMPNHVHAIVIVDAGTGRASPPPTLGNIVGGYKSGASRLCGFALWQRSYHDHIIRDEADYDRIAKYIEENPARWKEDCFYGGAGT